MNWFDSIKAHRVLAGVLCIGLSIVAITHANFNLAGWFAWGLMALGMAILVIT